MAGHPETKYAVTRDGVHIAYEVFGEGPLDILHCGVHWWHLEFQWTEPHWRSFLERLGTIGRVILFDKRGTGLSDRVPTSELPSMDDRIEDLVTVLDAVGVERAALYGSNYGAALALVFAASFPHRVDALVVENAMARLVQGDGYPHGITPAQAQRTLERMDLQWSEPVNLNLVAPSRAHETEVREWWVTMQRLAASPGAAVAVMRTALETDIRAVLPMVQCPTLVLHHRDNALIEFGHGRYIADRVPGAQMVELQGADLFFASRDDQADLIEEFLTGRPPPMRTDRVLAAVMFTDLVDSTGHLLRVGDGAWRELLDRHDQIVERALDRHRGRKVNSTGDGIVAMFDGPTRAVQCATAVCNGVSALGLQARAGVHVGEVELRGIDIGGIAVHVGARVAALAEPGEVLVTRPVTDLAAGSGLAFSESGSHDLKGIPGRWQLFAVRS